jgi:large subunit GTPase 1
LPSTLVVHLHFELTLILGWYRPFAERQNVKIIQAPTSGSSEPNPYLLSSQEEKDVKEKQGKWRDKLRVPRRPVWDKGMTARELERSERDSFLDWRRGLAE